MQAVGDYVDGRMLFVGVGTGPGTSIVADHVVVPLELAGVPYRNGHSYEAHVGVAGRARLGDAR
jgi:polyphosphate glucokinase